MNRRDLLQASLALSVTQAARSSAVPVAQRDLGSIVAVQIDPSRDLGPAASIGDLIGSQYEPYTFGFRQSDAWGVSAWRELDLNVSDIGLFNYSGLDPQTTTGKVVGIHVARNSDGRLVLDFSDFDRNINYMRQVLGIKTIGFSAWGTPKAVGDPAAGDSFFFHAPANYDEWAEILRSAVLHIKNELGLAGASYKSWTEPDSGWYWRGRALPGRIIKGTTNAENLRDAISKDFGVLDDYVAKYIRDWHTIKAADPSAQMGGPFTVFSTSLAAGQWSLDDFLARIKTYNEARPAARVTVDELVYQDYNWHGKSLSEGVIAAEAVKRKFGLPASTPLVLAGWNNGMKNDQSLQLRATYLTANIIRELIPVGRPRSLSRAYLWPFDYDYYAEGIGLVSMPNPAVSYSGDDGYDGPLHNAAITGYHKRPSHAALKLLTQMKAGKLVYSHASEPTLAVLASVQEHGRLRIVVANESKRSFRLHPIVSGQQPLSQKADVTIQRVDTTHSADGTGLENGSRLTITVGNTGSLPPLDLPAESILGVTIDWAG